MLEFTYMVFPMALSQLMNKRKKKKEKEEYCHLPPPLLPVEEAMQALRWPHSIMKEAEGGTEWVVLEP